MAALQEKFHGEGEAAEPPSVFLHAFANRDECCLSAGHGTLDGLITRAGGHNIGTEKLQGAIGQLNLEFVIVRNPDIYLATTVPHDAESGGFALGPGVAEDQARTGFERLLSRADLLAIGAVNNRRAFGMWHQFTHTPLHVVALEALAKFLHPELFGDLDPHATLADINQRFLAAPLDGTLWTTADSAPEE
jgi:iron complex transport system substrate-binding protein